MPQRLEALDVGVRKVASEPQLGTVLYALSVLVKLGPDPDLLSLEAVVADQLIIKVQGVLKDELLVP